MGCAFHLTERCRQKAALQEGTPMVCDADVAVAVFASNPFVREGLASLLRGSRFHVISTAAIASGVITPAEDQLSPLLILAAPEGTSEFEAVHRELGERQIICDFRPDAGIRIGPHYFNTDDELRFAIAQVAEILETGAYERHFGATTRF